MIILAKLELTLLIIVTAHGHVVFRLTRMMWLTLIVLISLTALCKPSVSQNCSLLGLSHSSHLLGGEYIFYYCSCDLSFHFQLQLVIGSLRPLANT